MGRFYTITEISSPMTNLLLNYPSGVLGTVHSVFNSSCNIKTHGGPLLTLQNAKIARTPMSLCFPEIEDFGLLSLKPGQSVFYSSGTQNLQIGRTVFSLTGAREFSTQIVIKKHKIRYSDYLRVVESVLRDEPANLYHLLMSQGYSTTLTAVQKALAQKISKAVEEIKEGFLNQDEVLIIKGIDQLLGLGIGLTPGGDDLLLGLLTIVSMEEKYSIIIESLKDKILNLARTSTTEISYEFIAYFFRHCYAQPSYQLIKALNDDNRIEFRDSLPVIAAIGHSSGQDFLTGVYLGLDFLEKYWLAKM